MLKFSSNGPEAEKQMRAVIFYLTTFGYIDGDFDTAEKEFVRGYIKKLVVHRVAGAGLDAKLSAELTAKFTTHFLEVFESIDRQVMDLFTEAVAEGEAQDTFVHAKLKLRCFEIFKSFDEASQEQLMATVDELIHADGSVHPAEAKFRAELADLLNEQLGVELLDDEMEKPFAVATAQIIATKAEDHPFFAQFEQHYSANKEALVRQVDSDRTLMDRVIAVWDQQRALGRNKLKGKTNVNQFAPGSEFLDGHVHLLTPEPGKEYELTIIGDLHGCYSCLKAVLTQTDVLRKIAEYERKPDSAVCPKLVLLGDYIDRGMFSYQGVLRSVLQLFSKHPEHVVVLRGNHEYYVEHQGKVYGAVRPSEAMSTLKPHFSDEVFQHYIKLFESMPTSFLFEKFMFVHGGIPKDSTIKSMYRDLSSLNEWDIRFQMMWSDPSGADVIPASLQDQSARFPFGKLQCQAFLQKLGCHTIFRGHEKVDEGFRQSYAEDAISLFTVFSSGGATNDDLPADSSYRSVTPMAATLRFKDGKGEVTPFAIDYESFNDPARNKFYQSAPEIAHSA
jgi:Calcineurin-like phosphoesterase